MKKNIQAYIKEIITIILGILIAMYINNWNENRKDKKYIDQISTSINKELVESNKDIVETITKQKMFADTLDFYKNDNKISIIDITIKSQGFYVPMIKINSWKAISNSKLELMEYDKISALANVEEQKEYLKAKSERLTDFVYSNGRETGKDKKEFLKLLLKDVMGTEIVLQKGIKEIVGQEAL